MGILRDYGLSDPQFCRFKKLIYNESGIKLSGMKKALLQARLAKRIRALELGSFEEYYNYLIDNYQTEKYNFINVITTNKTEFFRESKHFHFIRDVFLPMLEQRGQGEIRIWSAGCSTGEEAYTIAITVREYYKNRLMPPVKILATDIDTGVLEKAEKGIYDIDHVKKINIDLLKRYFLRGTGENAGLFKVKRSLKDMIYFRRLNLNEDTYPMKKKFDLIFCRNVIIYFDKEKQRELFQKFYHYLEDRGRLFLGHSENITSISDKFYPEGSTIYRKVI